MEKDKISRKTFTELSAAMVSLLLSMNVVKLIPLPPRTRQTIHEREADVLLKAQTSDGKEFILHLEFQTTNDPKMAIRMAVYDYLIYAETGLEVHGIVIYIGKSKLNMKNKISFAATNYSCPIIDIRTLDTQLFINSNDPRQVIFALLTGFHDKDARIIIRKIISKLQQLLGHSEIELTAMIMEMECLGQIRSKHIQKQIKKEVSNMPVILDRTKSLYYQEAHRIGKRVGKKEGRVEGKLEGERRGELRNKRSNALNLMREGVSLDIISRSTGLSIDELLDLKQESDKSKD